MSLFVVQGAVEQGFIYSLVALALYLSFRTLDIADLTTDGTFTLGAACSAVFTVQGHPVLGLLLAFLLGCAAGLVTALLQTKLGVQPILAGIITMTGLYTVNLVVMGGRSNLNMLKEENVFTAAEALLGPWGKLILSFLLAAGTGLLLALFLRTRLGLSIRATGDNRDMVASSSINPAFTTAVGLCLANAMTALSGGLLAQYQKFSDVSLGTGMVVIGLASLIIGEVVLGRGGVLRGVAASLLGAVIYRIIIAAALTANVNAQYFKLVSAVIVAAAISYPAVAEKLRFQKKRREAERNG
jgi:putative ABC transport system permease protein